MNRWPIPFLLQIPIAGLVRASAASGAVTVSHGIAGAGLSGMVICDSDGARVVALDRDGTRAGSPVTRASGHKRRTARESGGA